MTSGSSKSVTSTKKKRRIGSNPSKDTTSSRSMHKHDKKRIRSSDTDPETSTMDTPSNEEIAHMASAMEEEEQFTDFIARIGDHWDGIVQKIQQSSMWKDMEESLNQAHEDIHNMSKENEVLKKRLHQTEGRLTRVERKLEEANEKIIDLTARSMRDNLIFKNVEEENGENLDEVITNICRNKLKMSEEDIKDVQIERVHRGRKPARGRERCRDIIAKFTSKGKSKIMLHLKNMRRDEVMKIQEQFPPEIQARRNKLWPQFIQARQSKKEAKFVMDKLIVNKQVIKPPQDKVKDINLDVAECSLNMRTKHTPACTSGNNHFQGHIVPVGSPDDVIPAIQALCRDQRIAGASHIAYAYQIGNERRFISNYEDDGEWGAGKEIMTIVNNNKCFNHLVAVSRWYSGTNLGPDRFRLIRSMAEEAVALVADRSRQERG